MRKIYVSDSLVLAPIDDSVIEPLFDLIEHNRTYLREWLPWLDFNRSVDDTRAFVERSKTQAEAGEAQVYVIQSKGAVSGVIGFNSIDTLHRVCEIGYWLDQDHMGHGIMSRSTRRLIEFAFDTLDLNKVSIPVAEGNAASRAIPERLGFRIEGVSRQAEWLYDHYVDHVLYAMLKADWPPGGTDERRTMS